MATERPTMTAGQLCKFQPSVSQRVRTPLDATVTKVWGPGCVNVLVTYPDGIREETSVLTCFPGQDRPTGGYYAFPL